MVEVFGQSIRRDKSRSKTKSNHISHGGGNGVFSLFIRHDHAPMPNPSGSVHDAYEESIWSDSGRSSSLLGHKSFKLYGSHSLVALRE